MLGSQHDELRAHVDTATNGRRAVEGRDVPDRSAFDRVSVRGNAFVAFLLHSCCGPGTSRAPVAVSRNSRPLYFVPKSDNLVPSCGI